MSFKAFLEMVHDRKLGKTYNVASISPRARLVVIAAVAAGAEVVVCSRLAGGPFGRESRELVCGRGNRPGDGNSQEKGGGEDVELHGDDVRVVVEYSSEYDALGFVVDDEIVGLLVQRRATFYIQLPSILSQPF